MSIPVLPPGITATSLPPVYGCDRPLPSENTEQQTQTESQIEAEVEE